MKPLTLFSIVAGIAVTAALVGFLGFAALRYQDAYTRSYALLQRFKIIVDNSALTYGTLRAYDPQSRMMDIEIKNQYTAGGQPRTMRLLLSEGAFIGRQEITSDGAHSYLSSTTPATAADLQLNTHVKFFTVSTGGQSTVPYLLFGNPL